ncbi:MAG: ATP synthase F1 subunit delta [bacterium]|nr:MAG: ATP synthase F1 subunit delta [bacterium]
MIGFVLARRYAKAVIDLAHEQGIIKEVGEDLQGVAAIFAQSPELLHAFSDPTVSLQDKEKILEKVLARGKIKDLTLKFLHVLLMKKRILGVGEICQAYIEFADQLANRIRARVVTAVALDKEEEKRIKDALNRLSGKEVILELEVDAGLLGGIVAYMGGQVYDGSLSNQLHQVKESIGKGR